MRGVDLQLHMYGPPGLADYLASIFKVRAAGVGLVASLPLKPTSLVGIL
jgi:hypothetical protein